MIVLYSTGCPKCNILKKKLDLKKIKYDICEDTNIMLNKGIYEVPMLEIEGDLKTFLQAVDWISKY